MENFVVLVVLIKFLFCVIFQVILIGTFGNLNWL